MLADQEINIPDELLGYLVSEDAGQTKTSVEAFVKLYKGAVQEAVKNALKGNPRKLELAESPPSQGSRSRRSRIRLSGSD